MTVYTVSQLAEILQRSRSSIVSLIRSGRLKAFDASPDGRLRQWRVTQQALDAFVDENSAKPAAAVHRRVAKPRRQYV